MEDKRYYQAYDIRYKAAHSKGVSWASESSTPMVIKTIEKYGISKESALLEIGCGEGRDSKAVLELGYNLLATDVSGEAVLYCQRLMPEYKSRFRLLDCLTGELDESYDFIYSVAVIHMLVLDCDRDGFYQFIKRHLKPDGIALILTMGDGETQMQTDINSAFDIVQRSHESGKMMVASTSCRMSLALSFRKELERNGLYIIEDGLTDSPPDFNSLLYAVVRRSRT